jgi:prefoldin subunit 5
LKRDIQICYDELSVICNDLLLFQNALEEIKLLKKEFNSCLLENNSGLAVDALRESGEKIDRDLKSCEEEIQDLYTIFSQYIQEMQGIINSNNSSLMIRVDRNDIKANIISISNTILSMSYLKNQSYAKESVPSYLPEVQKKSQEKSYEENYKALEKFRETYASTCTLIENDMQEIEKLYYDEVVAFENMDDELQTGGPKLYVKYSSESEFARGYQRHTG